MWKTSHIITQPPPPPPLKDTLQTYIVPSHYNFIPHSLHRTPSHHKQHTLTHTQHTLTSHTPHAHYTPSPPTQHTLTPHTPHPHHTPSPPTWHTLTPCTATLTSQTAHPHLAHISTSHHAQHTHTTHIVYPNTTVHKLTHSSPSFYVAPYRSLSLAAHADLRKTTSDI